MHTLTTGSETVTFTTIKEAIAYLRTLKAGELISAKLATPFDMTIPISGTALGVADWFSTSPVAQQL